MVAKNEHHTAVYMARYTSYIKNGKAPQIHGYSLYDESYTPLGYRDLTQIQAESFNLIFVSPKEVYEKTNGTMGYKNLPQGILDIMQEQYNKL